MNCKKCNQQFKNPELEYFSEIKTEEGEIISYEFLKKKCPKCFYVWYERIINELH